MTTTARAAARRTAAATTTKPVEPEAPAAQDEPAAPVVPPPAAQSPEDQTNERLDVLEELAAHQAEQTQKVAESVDASTAQVVQATEALGRFMEGAEARNREALDAVLAVAERVTALEQRSANTGEALAMLDRRLGDVASTVGQVVSGALGREVQGVELEQRGEHVHYAIGAVMREVREIGKSGQHNSGGQSFKYRKLDEIMDAIGAAMRTHGLYVLPSILNNTVERWTAKNSQNRDTTVTSVVSTVRYTFVSTVDGSRVDMDMVGEGRDNGDKATSKSVAMAYKYALLQALCIPVEDVTGMDVENFDPPTEAPTGRPQFNPNPQYQRGDAMHARSGGPIANIPAQVMDRARAAQALAAGAQRYAQQAQPPANPLEAATRALAAARQPGLTLDKLNAIASHANALGITQVEVEGQPLAQHLWAVKGILDQAAQTRAANTAPGVVDNPPESAAPAAYSPVAASEGRNPWTDELPWEQGETFGAAGPNSGWPHP